MNQHVDISKIARKSFSEHALKPAVVKAWSCRRPGTGAYGFRVLWSPGVIVVKGDIGEAVYCLYPAFATPWDAAELIARAEYDYLTGKTDARKEYDREATAEFLLELADEYMREQENLRYWEKIVGLYNFSNHQDPKARAAAAAELRDDPRLMGEKVYDVFGDPELCVHSYRPGTRWTFEAVRWWARAMLAAEPGWHRALRWLRDEWKRLRRVRRRELHFRPALHVPREGGTFNGCRHWLRKSEGEPASIRFVSIYPFRALGIDLSKLGLWREGGSSWPDEDKFVPLQAGERATREVRRG